MRVPSGAGLDALDAWRQAARQQLRQPRAAGPETAGGEGLRPAERGGEVAEAEGPGFGERLAELVGQVDAMQKEADRAAEDFAEGRSHDIHGTLIALGKADVAFRLLGAVRNRALEAYREVMRMGA